MKLAHSWRVSKKKGVREMRIKIDSFIIFILSVIIMIVLIILGICVNIIKVS